MTIEEYERKLDAWYERMVDRAFTSVILSYPGMSMEVLYEVAIDMEKEREASHRTTKQGAFEAEFSYYDAAENIEDLDDSKNPYLSDCGHGEKFIINYEHFMTPQEYLKRHYKHREERWSAARALVEAKLPKSCLKVFDLIRENGSNRKESIWKLMTMLKTDAKMRVTKSKKRKNGVCKKRSTIAVLKKS